jgi:hypothetical protein
VQYSFSLSGFGHPRLAKAQGNYEIQVYSSDTVAPKITMLKLHTNFAVEGSSAVPGSRFTDEGTYPTNHAKQETVEITQGVISGRRLACWVETEDKAWPLILISGYR